MAYWSLEVDATNGEGLCWNFDQEPELNMPGEYNGQVVMYSGTWDAHPMHVRVVIAKVDAWTTRKHEEEG